MRLNYRRLLSFTLLIAILFPNNSIGGESNPANKPSLIQWYLGFRLIQLQTEPTFINTLLLYPTLSTSPQKNMYGFSGGFSRTLPTINAIGLELNYTHTNNAILNMQTQEIERSDQFRNIFKWLFLTDYPCHPFVLTGLRFKTQQVKSREKNELETWLNRLWTGGSATGFGILLSSSKTISFQASVDCNQDFFTFSPISGYRILPNQVKELTYEISIQYNL